jgi:hypothetical protein
VKLTLITNSAPDTTGGKTTCYACTADPDDMPDCPRCHGSGQEP